MFACDYAHSSYCTRVESEGFAAAELAAGQEESEYPCVFTQAVKPGLLHKVLLRGEVWSSSSGGSTMLCGRTKC